MSTRSDIETAAGDFCEVELVHPKAVERARRVQASDREIDDLAETFQMFASPTRLRILEALAAEELCVCDLAELVGTSQSAVSHHLRHLRTLRLVRFTKRGRMAYYALDDDHVGALLRTGFAHVREARG